MDAYCFLLSYAHFDFKNDSDRLMRRFFDDLDREAKAFGFRAGGFMDEAGIEVGDLWEQRLGVALRTSYILVPLCSPNYFQSENCGKEWTLFETRYRVASSTVNAQFIMPVIWVPTEKLLEVAPEIQNSHRSYPEAYVREGLRHVLRAPKFGDAYSEFLHVFVKQLVNAATAAARAQVPPPPASFADVAPKFPASSSVPGGPQQNNASGRTERFDQHIDFSRRSEEQRSDKRAPQQTRSRWERRGLALVRAPSAIVVAVLLLLLANTATLAGSSPDVLRLLARHLGIAGLPWVAAAMTAIVVAFFALGYLALVASLSALLWYRLAPSKWRIAVVVACIVAIGMLGIRNGISALQPTALSTVVEDELLRTIQGTAPQFLGMQTRDGGIRGRQGDPTTQVWTTAQALKGFISLKALANSLDASAGDVRLAFEYMERERKPDGWGYMPSSPHSVTEIIAWVVLAYTESLRRDVFGVIWTSGDQERISDRIRRDVAEILSRRYPSGGFGPFADRSRTESYTRTYSTILALWALTEWHQHAPHATKPELDAAIRGAVVWLLETRDRTGRLGWVPNPNRLNQRESFPGLDAQTLYVLLRARRVMTPLREDGMLQEERRRFLRALPGRRAMIDQNNRMHDSDLQFPNIGATLEGSTMLWYPWTFLTCSELTRDRDLSNPERAVAERCILDLGLRAKELEPHIRGEFMYVWAENTYAVSRGIVRHRR